MPGSTPREASTAAATSGAAMAGALDMKLESEIPRPRSAGESESAVMAEFAGREITPKPTRSAAARSHGQLGARAYNP
jgi:hypothetical protein